MTHLPEDHNNTVRCYPRTLEEAFPKSADYAEAIEHYRASDSGLFDFVLLVVGLGMLCAMIGVFL
jgi:hypothetical protein